MGQVMTKGQRRKLTEKITTEIDMVKKLIAVLFESKKLLFPEDSGRRFSLREKIKAESVKEGALRAAKSRLNKLERALKKINDTDFGICFICEQAIPFMRLIEMPAMSRCVRCEDI
jgi:DnaK suppressor protein